MARVTGPLMSFDASGSIAGAVVFSKWRGRNYVRRHAVPSNPRTAAQVAARAIIAFLGKEWAGLTAPNWATWDELAEAAKYSSFNAYVHVNARNWRDQYTPSIEYPAARVQAPGTVDSLAATVSGRQVEIAFTASPGANDWAIVLCRSAVMGFTASPSNAVQIANIGTFAGPFVDGPLAPGTYYYNGFLFTEDGVRGLENTEESAVVS